MIVDINKIIVKDRIRKDFGDIQELADDIQQNGLINPPVVNKEYELLAGERRLRACKSLGWKQIEVRMMDTRDAEHELNVEISENENRKEFSKSERVDYMKRLLRIEQAKSREISDQNLKQNKSTDVQKSAPRGKTRDVVSNQFGISHDTMEKEMSIVDNKDLLDPSDFADWDEGKLSTNKAYQKIKVALQDMKEERDYLQFQLEEEKNKEPKVVTKTVEVVPDDYEDLKKSKEASLKDYQYLEKERQKDLTKIKELQQRIEDLETRKDINELQKKLEEEAGYFSIRTYDYIKKNGGFVWITERMEQLPEKQRKEFINTVYAIDAFAKQMVQNIGGYGIE